MAQISIDTPGSESIIFVVDIKNVLSGKDHVQVTNVPVCAIGFCLRSRVYNLLNSVLDDLSRLTM